MQTLESLAYTLNHIYLEDRKVRTYEIPEIDNNLMAAEPEPSYGKAKHPSDCPDYSILLFTLVPFIFSKRLMLSLYRPIHGRM